MLFHRRQDAQITLDTSRVVIANILLDHLDKLPLTGKPSAVIAFPFQNTPEALHRTVIDAMRHTGHTLRHARLYELVDLASLVPLEFGHIGEPLLIGLCGIKLPAQKVLGKILRVLRLSGAAMVVVLDRGTDISDLADAENPLVIDMDTVVMTQAVIESPVALIRTFLMDILDRIREMFVLRGPMAQLAGSPLVVCRTRRVEQLAGQLNGIFLFSVCLPDRGIDAALSYFRKASLLSISSNFFSRSRSISTRYSLCLSCSISICAFSSSVLGV